MDLGISGKQAIVCASSKGLGRGCAESLAANGVNVVLCARTKSAIDAAAAEIEAAHGIVARAIACDITTDAGRAAVLEACPVPDILVNNAGGPPAGDFRDWEAGDWQAAVNANMITPILLIRAVVDGMMDRGFGRIVNITSSAVKSPIPQLGLSNGARAGLTGFVAGLARQTVRQNVTINGILPGPFDTDRIATVVSAEAAAQGISETEARTNRQAANPAGRFGSPHEFGELCAFLCSAQAGYINGQNILIDGGGVNVTL